MDQDHTELLTAPRGAIWLATAFTFYTEKVGRLIDRVYQHMQQPAGLNEQSTPQEVIEFANRIKDREPGFAADLIAAASRAQE